MSSESLYSWHELILEEILKVKWENEKVLDLGCGDGRLTNQLTKIFLEGVALDFSENMLKVAKKRAEDSGRAKLGYICASAQKLPFKDNSFDVVVSSELIEHVPGPEKVILEINRVLDSKGHLYLTTPNPYAIHTYLDKLAGKQDLDKKSYSVHEGKVYDEPISPRLLRNMIEKGGFRIIKRFNGPLPLSILYKYQLYKKMTIITKADVIGQCQIICAAKT